MTLALTGDEQAMLAGEHGEAAAMALRIVVQAARLLGAPSLVEITSAHIDGCLYHGPAGLAFAERLRDLGGRVAVPASLNVGALDLIHPEIVRADADDRAAARRQMDAYVALGCMPSWTCAPYQAGHRPGFGEQVAWGESNAVAFANSVLGARTNRYGDFLDICTALTGRAPYCGLHVTADRRATVLIDAHGLSPALKALDAVYPVLGAWLGGAVGDAVAVIDGLSRDVTEDRLKALGAGAAATGAVGLFHVAGVTPEAATVGEACQGEEPEARIVLDAAMIRDARDRLSTAHGEAIDCVALGSPHFSQDECSALADLIAGRTFAVPVYVCTRRDLLGQMETQGLAQALRAAGVTFVTDTCVVVTPILAPKSGGVMMTNSAKFAHYAPANTGYASVFGTLADCVASAVTGRVTRDEALWQ